ncbi:deoxyuridine triphosphatase [Equid alphaherpesvirus 3]|uniref:Deoxyuridine triphosphatase n=1 Tax=Equid alphaherpesvirus 3 TaxID=80341 RepID=A0A077B9N2_9ALPH|nr:deoxyuridine triphosphatase [Equid alphaherpesvirus 3]AIL02926.1 deoxyuridine triphosphatase [Equid alphaherpesvirus 3]
MEGSAKPREAVIVVECDKKWRAVSAGDSSLVLINKHPVELSEEAGSAGEFYSVPADVGVRLAFPSGYAIILAQISGWTYVGNEPKHSSGRAKVSTAVGVIDSGYRGPVKAVLFPSRCGPRVTPWRLAVGLIAVRLAPGPIRAHRIDSRFSNSSCGEDSFYEYFAPKREEDAGYDVRAANELQLGPRERRLVELPVVFGGDGAACQPCIFGRSSMNLGRLVVLPTRWVRGEPCRFVVVNMTDDPVTIAAGRRIAQLLLLADPEDAWWLGRGLNDSDPFPTYGLDEVDGPALRAPAAHAVKWTMTSNFDSDAPPSLRCACGFGSTGR